jgi:Protein of unknown function (DUF2911)
MSASKLLTLGFCAVLFCVLAAPRTVADTWNEATKITFSEPVQIPGQVLSAGTYWFTLLDSVANRSLVQIWNADHTQLIATIQAIPDYRSQPTGRTVMTLEERSHGQPEAIQEWFYPGNDYGQEFVYR